MIISETPIYENLEMKAKAIQQSPKQIKTPKSSARL